LTDNWFTSFAELKELDKEMMVTMALHPNLIDAILQLAGNDNALANARTPVRYGTPGTDRERERERERERRERERKSAAGREI